ncbi:MAG: MFS transporter [Gammaproteobacteria bacterium]
MPSEQLTAEERRAGISLAVIFFLRMFGLFMVTPVFALYAQHLEGATPKLIGVAIGIYGLTQAIFQVPFGLMSDRIGRKPVISAGLLIFMAGSVMAALSRNIYMLGVGRALQGVGAVGSATLALAADLTREEQRSKVMAMIGITIGLAFPAAFVAGPSISAHYGTDKVFLLAALLGLLAIGALLFWVPNPVATRFHRDCEVDPGDVRGVLLNGDLLRLDFGVLALHLIMTAMFVVLPLTLRDAAGLEVKQHWKVYLPVLFVSVFALGQMLRWSGKGGRMWEVFNGSVLAVAMAEFGLHFLHASLWGVMLCLLLFFTAFNFLEASLPSLISQMAPAQRRGTAMGVYSTCQFLGIFLGGLCGGWIHGSFGTDAVFLLAGGVAVLWIFVSTRMRFSRLVSRMFKVAVDSEDQAREMGSRLTALAGVSEAVVVAGDGVAYLKVDPKIFDPNSVRAIVPATG